jgi:hypothetical protein
LEEDLAIDFGTNFAHAFAVYLTKALEEMETRSTALGILKLCFVKSAPASGAFFLLPLIAYGQDDPLGLVTQVSEKCRSVSEFVFAEFGRRPQVEKCDMISYLAKAFGDRYSAHRIESIADILIQGVRKYPDAFASLKGTMTRKCWKMIEGEKSQQRIGKLAAVAAAFYAIDKPASFAVKMRAPKFVDNTIGTFIGATLGGVAEVCRVLPTLEAVS